MLSKLNIVVWATVAVLGFIPSAADAQQPTYKELGLKTVVIDPGHGGKDPGALARARPRMRSILFLLSPNF